jgi:HSP90 family molecular chaperone
MRDTFRKLDMWVEYKFWRNRTKQILDETKKTFYNNMSNESKDPQHNMEMYTQPKLIKPYQTPQACYRK